MQVTESEKNCVLSEGSESSILVYRFPSVKALFAAEKNLTEAAMWGDLFSAERHDISRFGLGPFIPHLCASDIGISGAVRKGGVNELFIRVAISKSEAVEEILGRPFSTRLPQVRLLFMP